MAPTAPVDVYRAVYLGTEMARKEGLEVGPEAVAYAADRLKSKLERDCVYNPITTVYDAFLSYRFLKERKGGGNVIYLDRHKKPERPEPEPGLAPVVLNERGLAYREELRRKAEARAEAERLPIISAAVLKTKEVGKPEFLVEGWLQNRRVGLLLGEDGSGKSFLLLMLAIAGATGGKWLGMPVKQGPVMFFTGEEEDRDLKERMGAAAFQPGVDPWSEDLHLIPMAGFESGAVLGELSEDRRGRIDMTVLWRALVTEVERIKPKTLVIEPLNEVFDGDEMIRRQARQFVANLRILAIKYDMAVLVAAHPSTASVKERNPGAGSNGWGAIMRARWWLEVIYGEDRKDTGERKLHRMKITGARNDRVPIELTVGLGGVLVPKTRPEVPPDAGLNAVLAKIERDKQEFLGLVTKYERQGRPLSPNPAARSNYAPKAIVKAEGGTNRRDREAALERTMNALFDDGRLFAVVDGYPSDNKRKLSITPEKPSDRAQKNSSPIANGDSPGSRSP